VLPEAAPPVLPDEALDDGEDAEPEGVLLEPLAALPEGEELGELIEPLALLEPPAAESFFVESADEELDEDGELGVETEPDAEDEPGELGEVLEPADDDAPEPGVVVRDAARSPALSPQAATPRARETAAAKIESFICGPPWVGVKLKEQESGPRR
jgi:hypothetical protein